MNFYNDIEPFAADWMANLIDAGELPPGVVSQKSIKELDGADLHGFTQCHFFAGIGGWSLALRLAGWPADVPVWTGSCPCQPFSAAGKRRGTDDERHLWPEFRRLIAQCRPAVVFGEQVASKDGRAWLSGVRTDLEDLGYAVGAADLCAAGVGAPHIRQRLFWVAYAASASGNQHEREPRGRASDAENDSVDQWDSGRLEHATGDGRQQRGPESDGRCAAGGCCDCRLADSGHESAWRAAGSGETENWWPFGQPAGRGGVQRLGDTIQSGLEGHTRNVGVWDESGRVEQETDGSIAATSSDYWRDVEFIPCRDGKARPTVPGVRLLAHGFPNRVGLLRGFGNAIVPAVAAEFIAAFLDSISITTHGGTGP